MWSVLSAYIATVSIFLLMPGPVNLAVVNATAKFGLKGAFASVVASNFASLLLISVAGLMMAGVSGIHHHLLHILSLFGGFYLIYHGYSLWRNIAKPHIHTQNPSPKTLGTTAIATFWIGIANPKDIVFFMTFFTPFVLRMQMDLLPALAILTLLWCILDYTILILYGLGIAKIRTPKIAHMIEWVSAILFIILGLYAITTGIMALKTDLSM